MTIFIPGNTAVENTRNLAQSALPDAPVVADEPRRGFEIRARVGALLRTAARRQQQRPAMRTVSVQEVDIADVRRGRGSGSEVA